MKTVFGGSPETGVRLGKLCGLEACYEKLETALTALPEEGGALMFLEVGQPGYPGPELLRELRDREGLETVFLAEDGRWAMAAWEAGACGYLVKPLDPAEVRRCVSRGERLLGATGRPHVEFRSFGRFDLVVDGRTVDFNSRKAKELLALLVALRGGMASMDFAVGNLWGDQPYANPVKGNYRKAVMRLRRTLAEYGVTELLRTERGRIWLNRDGVFCDYFRLLAGDPEAARQFHGQFMEQYSWGEPYVPQLEQRARAVLRGGGK